MLYKYFNYYNVTMLTSDQI